MALHGASDNHDIVQTKGVLEYVGNQESKGPATRNDIVNDIVDDPSSTMVFNVAKIASARASSTISLTKSLRVAGPLE